MVSSSSDTTPLLYQAWPYERLLKRPYFRLTRGGGTSTLSNQKPETKRRDLVVLAVLIEHPDAGLILFETGCAEDIEIVC